MEGCGYLSRTRFLVIRFLERIFREPIHLNTLTQDRDFLNLSLRDRRLVTQLLYGILRNRKLLDYYIGQLSNRPLDKLDETVLWIVRLGVYQLHFLRIPDRAAVHESVSLCRKFKKTSATSFVNALLRGFQREDILLPHDNSAHSLAIRFSHPEWLVVRYLKRYGVELTKNLLQRNNQPPTPFLWVNSFKIDLVNFCSQLDAESIPYEVCPQLPNCVIVDYPNFSQHILYQKGYCFFIDSASQEIVELAQVENKLRIGDFCCAPGGKSVLLASRKSANASFFCSDVNLSRLKDTRKRFELYEIPDRNFVQADLQFTGPFQEPFDLVLMDVPCSGLGTLRSNPDIRWRCSEQDLKRLHNLQFNLLKQGFDVLQPGGELVYSTCSTEPEENEWVIRKFLSEEPRAVLKGKFYRSFPEFHSGDCFFAAQIEHN